VRLGVSNTKLFSDAEDEKMLEPNQNNYSFPIDLSLVMALELHVKQLFLVSLT